MIESKTSKIKNHIEAGDYKKAISIASKFFDKSDRTKLYKQAQSAINNPSFYRQIGKDPDAIINEAIKTLSLEYGN